VKLKHRVAPASSQQFLPRCREGGDATGSQRRSSWPVWPVWLVCLACSFAFLAALPARAQSQGPPELARNVGIDQRLNEEIPLELVFRDENGNAVQLRQYFGDRPVILALVYYECPMLCTQVLNGLLRSLMNLSLDVGKHFIVLSVSISPREKPALANSKKILYLSSYQRSGASQGWHFLTGDEPSIAQLARSVGFRYAYDPGSGQYAHASGIMILTPQGRISKYFYGIEYPSRDLRLGLVEASEGKVGSPVDQILLLCYHYNPITGKYGLLISRVIQGSGLVTVLALGCFFFVMFRHERQARV